MTDLARPLGAPATGAESAFKAAHGELLHDLHRRPIGELRLQPEIRDLGAAVVEALSESSDESTIWLPSSCSRDTCTTEFKYTKHATTAKSAMSCCSDAVALRYHRPLLVSRVTNLTETRLL